VALTAFAVAFTVLVVAFTAAPFNPPSALFPSSAAFFTPAAALVDIDAFSSTTFFGLPRFFAGSGVDIAIAARFGRK
jgi:hypothetical protein